eukprot:1194519-Prymnesium_polylepis.1
MDKAQHSQHLLWTEDAGVRRAGRMCEHMLIHLDGETWTRGPDSESLAHEVCEAMRAGVHRLLMHGEVPTRTQDSDRTHTRALQ